MVGRGLAIEWRTLGFVCGVATPVSTVKSTTMPEAPRLATALALSQQQAAPQRALTVENSAVLSRFLVLVGREAHVKNGDTPGAVWVSLANEFHVARRSRKRNSPV